MVQFFFKIVFNFELNFYDISLVVNLGFVQLSV
jgi:hypothetical protein